MANRSRLALPPTREQAMYITSGSPLTPFAPWLSPVLGPASALRPKAEQERYLRCNLSDLQHPGPPFSLPRFVFLSLSLSL